MTDRPRERALAPFRQGVRVHLTPRGEEGFHAKLVAADALGVTVTIATVEATIDAFYPWPTVRSLTTAHVVS